MDMIWRWHRKMCDFFNDGKNVFYFSLGLSLTIVLLHVFFCIDVYDDVAGCYAPMAREIGRFNWSAALRDGGIPPLQPFLAGVLCMAGMEAFTASVLVSGMFYFLAAVPLFFLLRFFMAERYAGWGALLYVLCPKLIRHGCSGMPGAGKDFFCIAALFFLFAYFRQARWWKLAFLGACLSGLAMVRGEGLAFLPLTALAGMVMLLRKYDWRPKRAFVRELFLALVVTAVFFLLPAMPQMVRMYVQTGYPALDARQVVCIKEHLGVKVTPPKPAVAMEPRRIPEERKAKEDPGSLAYVLRVLNDFVRGGYELYLILGGVGLIVAWRRRQLFFEYAVLGAFVLFNALIFYLVTSSYRYFFINVLCLMPFTVWGLRYVNEWSARFRLGPLMALVFIGVALGQIYNGLAKLTDTNRFAYEKPTAELAVREIGSKLQRKMIIASLQPQYPFWADCDSLPLAKFGSGLVGYLADKQFDVVIIERKKRNREMVDALTKSNAYREIDHRWSGKVAVFVPIRK